MVDSYPQYNDYFEYEKPVLQPVDQANGAADAGEKQSTTDFRPRPISGDTGHDSENSQDHVPLARNDDVRTNKDNKVNRTALILEPGVDHYPHNAYRYKTNTQHTMLNLANCRYFVISIAQTTFSSSPAGQSTQPHMPA